MVSDRLWGDEGLEGWVSGCLFTRAGNSPIASTPKVVSHEARCLKSSPEAGPSRVRLGFFIDNLLVRIRFIIVMIRWTGLG